MSLKQLLKVIQKRFSSYVLIVTSDHGQHVNKTSAGKGSFEFSSNYTVPIYINSNSKEVMLLVRQNLTKCPLAFAVQIPQLIQKIMGYDTNISNCQEGYIANKRLTGNNGYLHIIQDKNQTKKELLMH